MRAIPPARQIQHPQLTNADLNVCFLLRPKHTPASTYTLPRGVPARKVQKQRQPDDEPKRKKGLKARFRKVLPGLFDKVRARRLDRAFRP